MTIADETKNYRVFCPGCEYSRDAKNETKKAIRVMIDAWCPSCRTHHLDAHETC